MRDDAGGITRGIREARGETAPSLPQRERARTELANGLAHSLHNRGNALADPGKLDDAIRDYQEAIEVYTRLVDEGRKDLAQPLASVRRARDVAVKQRADQD